MMTRKLNLVPSSAMYVYDRIGKISPLDVLVCIISTMLRYTFVAD